jgi:hypothetical protein
MVHEVYDPATNISLQVGGGVEGEEGGEGIQYGGEVFSGRLFQRGYGHRGAGFGSAISHVWRFLRPYAASAAKAVGAEGAKVGARILENLSQGANLKETAVTEGREGVKNLLEKAAKKMRGGGLRKGVSRRKKAVMLPGDRFPTGLRVNKRTALKKRARSDTFGFY